MIVSGFELFFVVNRYVVIGMCFIKEVCIGDILFYMCSVVEFFLGIYFFYV